MGFWEDETVDLVVTSPPYPMIEMWDGIMIGQNPAIGQVLTEKPMEAFELMHRELDKVWRECYRLLKEGGFLCINVGDATRTINKEFRLYNNHARIVDSCLKVGFTNLPNIIWRKQTNAPNKFMGSGMLPCGAYVTLEHEWILIFRKGNKRCYEKDDERHTRRASSFFWEERNQWFSDLWEIKGVKQKISNASSRERNASFPLEVPYRLINMYSQQGDTVLDPFYGLGTTTIAAMLTARNSMGVEIDGKLASAIEQNIGNVRVDAFNRLVHKRYQNHLRFVNEREHMGGGLKYDNVGLGCKVMTSQEVDLRLFYVAKISKRDTSRLSFSCSYFTDAMFLTDNT